MSGTDLLKELQTQRTVCDDILNLVQSEHDALSQDAQYQASSADGDRKNLLERLSDSLNSIRRQRVAWQQPAVRGGARNPQVDTLLRSNLDLIMRIIVLERENEQLLVRRGLLPPGRLPGKQPHFVSDVYRRSARA